MHSTRRWLFFVLGIMAVVAAPLFSCSIPIPWRPTISVTFPNGGEVVPVINGGMGVTWTSEGIPESERVVIKISWDSGNTWNTVLYHSNSGGCLCPAPPNATQLGRVKICCFVGAFGVLSDTSDGDFTTNQAGMGTYSFDYYAEYYNYAPLSGPIPNDQDLAEATFTGPPVDVFTGPPDEERMEFAIDYDWGDAAPEGAGVIKSDYFATRWTGIFYFDEGHYTFTATVDDGVRVYLDGIPIIDQWKPQVATTYEVTQIVSKGDHQVKVEYFERMGVAICQVSWQRKFTVTWSSPQRVTNNLNAGDRPSIIETSSRGTYQLFTKWILWQSDRSGTNEIYYTWSSDVNGAPWTDAIGLTSLGYSNYRPAPAIVRDGSSYSLWVVRGSARPSNYDIYYDYFYESASLSWQWKYASADGTILEPAEFDLSGSDQDPSVTQTSNGDIWIAWSSNVDGDYEIYLTYSTNKGTTWEKPFQITNNQNKDDMYPSITRTIDNIGHEYIWIAWHSNSDGDDEIYYTTFDPISYLWGSPKQLTYNTVPDRHPTVMQTQDGKIWIAWDELTTDNSYEIYYTLTPNWGTAWSFPVDITNDSQVDQTPWLTQTFDGRVWVVWATDRDGNLEIYAMYGIP